MKYLICSFRYLDSISPEYSVDTEDEAKKEIDSLAKERVEKLKNPIRNLLGGDRVYYTYIPIGEE